MIHSKQDFINKIHLIISVLIVVPASFVYGFNPSSQFDIHVNTIDEHSVFKAIMGLYLGFSILWVLGVFKANYLKLALVTNLIFMLGLGFGRLLSLVMDGTPTLAYAFGTFGEFILGFYGIWAYSRLK
jgi:hypothetical protein